MKTLPAAALAASAASFPALAMVVQNPSQVPAEYFDSDGLIKSWKGATAEDTKILRQLIEGGFIDGYTTKDVKAEHTRYARFTNKCLGDKISNLRRTHRDNVERRNQMDISGGGGMGLPAHTNTNPNTSQDYMREPDFVQRLHGQNVYQDTATAPPTNVGGNGGANDELNDGMSRLTVDDDEFSFTSHSVAVRSRGGVSFRSD